MTPDWPAWAAFEEDPGDAGSDLVNHWVKVYSALTSLLGSGGSVTVTRGSHSTELTAREAAERLEFWEGELRKRQAKEADPKTAG